MNASAMTTAADTLSVHTSLAQLFAQAHIQAIEIPLIQRDYAQGRRSVQVEHIRQRFIDSLYDALESEHGIDLDFVFGDVVNRQDCGKQVPTLYPLDGQQRLTTLFLLHCYLAWHIPETEGVRQPWHAFSYATRLGARQFCEFLTQCRPTPAQGQKVSGWLIDQARYLPTWEHDPTIQGMLVMLDALQARYLRNPDDGLHRRHWERLTDAVRPAIRFHLLPIAAQGATQGPDNTLYVKMNSRGKPLTDFENFKAELERLMRAHPALPAETAAEFSRKIDTDWADLFWCYRGNDLIDEEFMRYLRFLAEVRVWTQAGEKDRDIDVNRSDRQALDALAEVLFGPQSANASEHAHWMVRALDAWIETNADGIRQPCAIAPLFEALFTRAALPTSRPLRLFNLRDFDEASYGVNLFHACCDLYGKPSWRLAHTLLFYGVLCGRMAAIPPEDLHPRLRLLRNLVEASRDEIRAAWPNNMPKLLCEVQAVIEGGPLEEIKTFNQVQVANEHTKRQLLALHTQLQAALHQLEDHPLLRGGLTVFDLDPDQSAATFERRAMQWPILFAQPYTDVTAALLTYPGYWGRFRQHTPAGHRLVYLGAPKKDEPWDNLFRARRGEKPHPASAPLMALLDDLSAGRTLQSVREDFVHDPATPKDWRYYLVKYPAMRAGDSGCHVIGPGAGYALCMLKGDSCDQRSYHYDSYLFALANAAGLTTDQIGNSGKWPRCFPGDGTEARHLELSRSGIRLQCVDAGWQLSDFPPDDAQRKRFEAIAHSHPHYQSATQLYAVPQSNDIDTHDRIELGARLLRELVAAGL